MLRTPNFCLMGSCRPSTTGTGMERIKTSATMFKDARAVAVSAVFRHVPVSRRSHRVFSGRHAKMMIKIPMELYKKTNVTVP